VITDNYDVIGDIPGLQISQDQHRSMCGRFTQSYTWRELYELYRLTCQPVNIAARYNIAPTTMINVVVPLQFFQVGSPHWQT